MSPELAVLLSRVRSAKEPDRTLELWLDSRDHDELWRETWNAVPNCDQLTTLARLARVPNLWIADATRRADAAIAAVKLATPTNQRPLTATAGAEAFRAVVGWRMVADCLRGGAEVEAN